MTPKQQRRPHLELLERRYLLAGNLLLGVGALGDSLTAEYQFVGSRSTARNFVEQLADYRAVDFGDFDASRLGNQRAGYDYNWARGGEGTAGAIASGQHTGLASQIAAGDVEVAFVNLATIDLALRYGNIYSGSLAGPAVVVEIDQIMADLETILDTITAAGDVRIVLGNAGDFGVTPFIQDNPALDDPAKRQLVTDAVSDLNGRIQAYADARGIPVLDFFGWSNLSLDALEVGGVSIDVDSFTAAHSDPDHFFEDSQHPGSVAQGLLANIAVEALSRAYGIEVDPFSEQEILTNAGLTPPTTGPTFFNVSDLVLYNFAPDSNTGGPYEVSPGSFVTLDASVSSDVEDAIEVLVFSWDLDDDGLFETNGAVVEFDATSLRDGDAATVALRVTDSRGRSTMSETTISVVQPERSALVIDCLCDPTGQAKALLVKGSAQDDRISVRVHRSGKFEVKIRTRGEQQVKLKGNEPNIARIVVHALDGDDHITMFAQNDGLQVFAFGGDGDDRLNGYNDLRKMLCPTLSKQSSTADFVVAT
ncbi:MAG: hypothetical protein ACI9G1_002578 [Pirellulaceae bacterium]|jgi:hypothetical protein